MGRIQGIGNCGKIKEAIMAFRKSKLRGAGISLLVPFRANDTITDRRFLTWDWLYRYWENELPDAEIVVGTHEGNPFSKTIAINNAAEKAHGDIFVILDADCYMPGSVLVDCATQIREAQKQHRRLWFMPYRYFYRLSDEVSQGIITSDPIHPRGIFEITPDDFQLDDVSEAGSRHPHHHKPSKEILAPTPAPSRGHWYGALVQVMPRKAFIAAGMADERFAGWGGEDVSFMHAVDTLYARHHTTVNNVFHLWHPLAVDDNENRLWPGQDRANLNSHLATRYGNAMGDKDRMQRLVNEHAPIKRNWLIRSFTWLSLVVKSLWLNFALACNLFR